MYCWDCTCPPWSYLQSCHYQKSCSMWQSCLASLHWKKAHLCFHSDSCCWTWLRSSSRLPSCMHHWPAHWTIELKGANTRSLRMISTYHLTFRILSCSLTPYSYRWGIYANNPLAEQGQACDSNRDFHRDVVEVQKQKLWVFCAWRGEYLVWYTLCGIGDIRGSGHKLCTLADLLLKRVLFSWDTAFSIIIIPSTISDSCLRTYREFS